MSTATAYPAKWPTNWIFFHESDDFAARSPDDTFLQIVGDRSSK